MDRGTCQLQESTTWDARRIYGCVCDSSWSVGYGSTDMQLPEWYGPDCSRRTFKPEPELMALSPTGVCVGQLDQA
jgi:hypothetical protein